MNGREYVSHKMPILLAEGLTKKQALGKAFGMARSKGYDVPKPKHKKPRRMLDRIFSKDQ